MRCESEAAGRLLNWIVSQYREKGVPPCFYVSPLTRPEDFDERLKDRGFRMWDRLDVMRYVGGEPAPTEGDVEIRLADPESMAVWIRVFAESFDVPSSQVSAYWARSRRLFSRSDVDVFLAELGGRAVGCGALYSKDGVGGLYFLGTRPDFRRRGVASSVLEAAVKRSRERRNRSTVLQVLRRSGLGGFYRRHRFEPEYSKDVYILR